MNALHLVATLATAPTDIMVRGERYIHVEVFVRPPVEETPPLLPDRLRVVARVGTVAASRLGTTSQGEMVALSGSIRRSIDPHDWEVLATMVEPLAKSI